MDAIKKKMLSMKLEKENAIDKADQLSQSLKDKEVEMTKKEEEMQELQKKLSTVQGDCDAAQEALGEANNKLEATEKRAADAEGEVAALTRRVRLLEDDLEQTESRLQEATTKLEEASQAADESERTCKALDNHDLADNEKVDQLNVALSKGAQVAAEAEKKYEELVSKLAQTKEMLTQINTENTAASEKLHAQELAIRELSTSLKAIQIKQEKAAERSEHVSARVSMLQMQLAEAENRANDAEKDCERKKAELHQIKETLLREKEKHDSLKARKENVFAKIESL